MSRSKGKHIDRRVRRRIMPDEHATDSHWDWWEEHQPDEDEETDPEWIAFRKEHGNK